MLNVNKQSNQRADTNWMKNKTKPGSNYMLFTRDTVKLRVKVGEKI